MPSIQELLHTFQTGISVIVTTLFITLGINAQPGISKKDLTSPEITQCIQEMTTNPHNEKYAKGQLIVTFSNISLEEGIKLVNNLGLNYKKTIVPSSLMILVSTKIGEEFQWICILKNNPKIRSASVNGMSSATN